MNHLEAIQSIIDTLLAAGHNSQAATIKEERDASATGSELLMRVGHALKRLRESQPNTYLLVEEESTALIAYCHSIGLYPK